MRYVLAIDLGTTGNRVIAFDKQAKPVIKKYQELSQIYPKPGWVEHDPMEILEDVKLMLEEALDELGRENVSAIGIANQRETIVAWDKSTGKPVYNAIVWQDCRTEDECMKMKKDRKLADYVHNTTGLEIDPYFSATKIKWLIENVIKSRKGIIFGTIDSWIIWNLAHVHVTDHTNASRTMLYSLHTRKYDEALLEMFCVRKEMLPAIKDSSGIVGNYVTSGYEIPISGVAGDQQASLFGHRCFKEGEIKNTYGTGCFCLMNTGKRLVLSDKGLLTTIGISIGGKADYALEGSVFIAGAAIQWLRDSLGIITSAAETEGICTSVQDTHGAYFIPAFSGLGSPYWRTDVRGAIMGLTRGVTRKHIIRAAVESIAYQSRELIELMDREAGRECKSIQAGGGATANSFLMQFQSDILNKDISVPDVQEATALGAAMLAGLGVGFWKNKEELASLKIRQKLYKPHMEAGKRNELFNGWLRYVGQLTK